MIIKKNIKTEVIVQNNGGTILWLWVYNFADDKTIQRCRKKNNSYVLSY